jgi:hypothetical protein
VAQLVEHHATDSPQVAILPIMGSVVDFYAHVFLPRKAVVDQPFFVGMVAAPVSPDRAGAGPPRQRPVHPDLAVLSEVGPGVRGQEQGGGTNVAFQLLGRECVAVAPVRF